MGSNGNNFHIKYQNLSVQQERENFLNQLGNINEKLGIFTQTESNQKQYYVQKNQQSKYLEIIKKK